MVLGVRVVSSKTLSLVLIEFRFPRYKPNDDRISLMTISYGGRYGPAFMSYFLRQNEKIANGTIGEAGSHVLHIDTLGIMNGQ